MCTKLRQIKNFFKHKSVRLTTAFPLSCFNEEIWSTEPFEFNTWNKGKIRTFLFPGQKYVDFLNNNKIFKFLKKFREIKSYKNNQKFVISFTDIYSPKDIKKWNSKMDHIDHIDHKKWSYAPRIMFTLYKCFKKKLEESNKKYKFHAFIDIQNYYNSIYAHFLCGIQANNITEFIDLKKNYKDKIIKWIKDFFEDFNKQINYCKETNGISIGNGISDFVAELYSKLIDFLAIDTNESIKKELSIIRFRDDIYIFGNNEVKVNEQFYKYVNTMSILKLNINANKSYRATCNSVNILNNDEEKFRKELKNNKNTTFIQKAWLFCKKYDKSNKIFSLLQRAYRKNEIINNSIKSVDYLIKIYNQSLTNVLPLILSIIDKKPEIYSKFIKSIQLDKLSDSDKIWISCFERKHSYKTILFYRYKNIIEKIDKYFKLSHKTNFFHDANTWCYGE